MVFFYNLGPQFLGNMLPINTKSFYELIMANDATIENLKNRHWDNNGLNFLSVVRAPWQMMAFAIITVSRDNNWLLPY
jgi:hypothetical protein